MLAGASEQLAQAANHLASEQVGLAELAASKRTVHYRLGKMPGLSPATCGSDCACARPGSHSKPVVSARWQG